MGRRIAAALAAVVMIVGAVLVRRALDGDPVITMGPDVPVVCEPALETACNQAYGADRVTAEDPGAVADRIVAGEQEPIIWIAAPLWFDLVSGEAERRSRPAPITEGGAALAHTDLVFLATESADADCGGTVDWACLADPDRGLDIGLDPMSSTVGLESYGRIVAAHLGYVEFASNDFDADFSSWRRRLDASIDFATAASPAYSIFLARRGTYDVVTASSASLATLSRQLEGVTPSGTTIEVGAAAVGGAGLGRTTTIADALVAEGWEAGAAPAQERPSPGALQALR